MCVAVCDRFVAGLDDSASQLARDGGTICNTKYFDDVQNALGAKQLNAEVRQ